MQHSLPADKVSRHAEGLGAAAADFKTQTRLIARCVHTYQACPSLSAAHTDAHHKEMRTLKWPNEIKKPRVEGGGKHTWAAFFC